MLASALRLPARCPPRWSAPAGPALGACHRHSAQAPSLGAPRGLDAVADLARQMQDDSSALRGADARSALLADDRHHQTHEYKVAIFSSDGSVEVARKTGQALHIAVRDMPMFNTAAYAYHHATIAVRDERVLVRTEVVRAVLQRNKMTLFECRRPALSESVGCAALHAQQMYLRHASAIPFELQMLEMVLDQTVSYLEHKSAQIRLLSKAVEDDINKRVNAADIRRLLPLQKAVTALEYDIRETKHALREVADNEKLLALLCLSEDQNLSSPRRARWTAHMQLAHRLLMAQDSRIRSLDSQLRELTEHLDSTREVWHMQLDAMRNRIIRLNLHLEFLGIATMTAALPAALFGMNLVSGLEEVPGYFWAVSAGSVTWAVAVYVALAAYNSWPLRTYQRRLTDMTALQDVLAYNVDVIGEVVEQLRLEHTEGKVNKEDFARVVRRTMGHAPGTSTASTLSKEKLDVLYRVLDTDKDGLLDVSELERHHAELLKQ